MKGGMMEGTINERLDRIEEVFERADKKKIRRMRIPSKARVSRSKAKRGYVTILKIDENKNVDFERQPVEGGTYTLKTDTTHATNEKSILNYKGKPFIIQPVDKLNPYNPSDENETYGQPYVKARMLKDVIKPKRKGGAIIIYIIIGLAALYLLSKGGLF